MDPAVSQVAIGALGNLVAAAAATASGGTWKSLRDRPEARTVRDAATTALVGALGAAARADEALADEGWVAEVAQVWRSAFTSEVVAELVACLADPRGDQVRRFADLAQDALEASGCDLAVLDRTFWVEEFLAILPRRLLSELRRAALRDEEVRGLVGHLLAQRGDSRADEAWPASPGEFRRDLIALLRALETWARGGWLPGYLSTGADPAVLSRSVMMRETAGRASAEDAGSEDPGGKHGLLGKQSPADGRVRPWHEVAAANMRVIVLSDPGLGKSWLIRSETRRLCRDALAGQDGGNWTEATFPVPLRCDQLAEAPGPDLAGKIAAHLAEQGLLPGRSCARLAARIRHGDAVLLLDALDEVTPAQDGRLRTLMREWAGQAGERARCVITSRLAGYTGSPLPGACEVELQPFTAEDVAECISAWDLPPAAMARLNDQAKEPVIAAMTRIPLLLALICSLAASPIAGDLPRSRGQLLDRVLRWFLTRSHRSPDSPVAPPLDDFSVSALLELLAPLAYAFASWPGGWIDLMPQDRLLKQIRTAGPPFTELGRPAAEIMRELSVKAGILVPAGDPSAGRSPHYLFFHRAVAEYLVARHLASLPEPQWLAVVEEHRWFDPDWAEVIPMLGEYLDPPAASRLIEHLADADADPFHHSLLTAARVWGARADADQLLRAKTASMLAQRLTALSQYQATREALTSRVAAMAYLPQPLLSQLLGMLGNPDANVRAAIVRALADRDKLTVTNALLNLLTDSDGEVRQQAAKALAGRDKGGVTEALLNLVSHQDQDVRKIAARTLADREGRDVTNALLNLLADSDHEVRWEVTWALAGREGPGVTDALLTLLEDPYLNVRVAAAQLLADRQTAGVADVLLNHPDQDVREAAARALAKRKEGDSGQAPPLEDMQALLRWAESLGGPLATEALLSQLTEPNEKRKTRLAALDLLASREGAQVTDALVNLLTDSDRELSWKAAEALENRNGAGVTEALLNLLNDPHAPVRAAAARAMTSREEAGVTEALLNLLNDPDRNTRLKATEALADRDEPSVTDGLLDQLNGDPDLSVRRAAARGLAKREGTGITEALLSLLTVPEKYVQLEVVMMLEQREATQALAGWLTGNQEPDQIGIPLRVALAEQLMSRNYRRTGPSERLSLRVLMSRLTESAEVSEPT
jgi:HEAT repeat protein